MNSPQLIIIEARRKALGDEHPDFSGPAGLIEVKHAAQAPPEPPDSAPDQPDQADLAHGAARIATELRQIADRTCELSEELASLLKAREPGAKD